MEMTNTSMQELLSLHLAPYIQISTELIGKERRSGGNMFRHQMDTMTILLDYGYTDNILLKASLVHDVIEDIEGFDVGRLLAIEPNARRVVDLVLEVTKRQGETKGDFLTRILRTGSEKARLLKTADRISNMISLGYVTDLGFIDRYCNETEFYVFPIALGVNYDMYQELIRLTMTRRKFLEASRYFLHCKDLNDADYERAFTID